MAEYRRIQRLRSNNPLPTNPTRQKPSNMTPDESKVEAIQGILAGGNASGSYHKGDQTLGKTVRLWRMKTL